MFRLTRGVTLINAISIGAEGCEKHYPSCSWSHTSISESQWPPHCAPQGVKSHLYSSCDVGINFGLKYLCKFLIQPSETTLDVIYHDTYSLMCTNCLCISVTSMLSIPYQAPSPLKISRIDAVHNGIYICVSDHLLYTTLSNALCHTSGWLHINTNFPSGLRWH